MVWICTSSALLPLQTRDVRLAQCSVALLNLRAEAMKKIPNLDAKAISALLEYDVERGIFRADTAEKPARGLHFLEGLGRASANKETPP